MVGDIYALTKSRLHSYGLFSDATIRTVADVARAQQKHASFRDLFKEVGIPTVATHTTQSGRAVTYVDLPAKSKTATNTLVLHTSMGNPLDPNQLFQVATIAAANPRYRIIAFGNPSGAPHYIKQQGLRPADWFAVAFTKNVQSIVDAELDYLRSQGVTHAIHAGYSYGALKAVVEAIHSEKGSVDGIILVDPVASPRSPVRLAKDFARTYEPLGSYVNRVELPSYHEARGESAKIREYRKTLLRPINIAIGLFLARADILQYLQKASERHPKARVVVAWGTESELGDTNRLQDGIQQLEADGFLVEPLPLHGDKHALANDIYLHAAIIHKALT